MQQLTNIQAIENAVNEYGEIVISKTEKNNVILMSMEEYKKNMLNREIDKKLIQSEEDYKNGRVKDADVVFEEWKTKYGI